MCLEGLERPVVQASRGACGSVPIIALDYKSAKCMASFSRASVHGLTPSEHKKFLQPVEKGMLVQLHTMDVYETWMKRNGVKVVRTEILNEHCVKTQELCLDIIKDKMFWAVAAKHGLAFVHYLRAFKAMRDGYDSGNSIYGLMVAEKP